MEINNINKDYIDNARYKAMKKDEKHVIDVYSWRLGWESAIKFAKQIDKAYHICDHCHTLILPAKNGEADYVIGEDCILCSKCNDKLQKGEI